MQRSQNTEKILNLKKAPMRSVILNVVIFLTVLFVVLHRTEKAEAELIIDTVSGWGGSTISGGSFRAVGQTFTVEEPNTVLESFTLYVIQAGEFVQPFTFRVMEWNGFVATGPVLFESSSQINGPAGPDPFTFDVGGLQLIAGKEYVAFVDIGPIPTGEFNFFGTAVTTGSGFNPYPNGYFVAAWFGQELTSDTWRISPNGADPSKSVQNDLAFIAIFSSEPPPVTTVTIDIKPGEEPNCFNNNTRGVIPIAILSNGKFNVTQVDPSTVQLAGLVVKVAGKSNKYLAHTEDVNGDGLIDLVVQIEDTDQVFTTGTTIATLTGNLFAEYGGTPIEGTDSICVVP